MPIKTIIAYSLIAGACLTLCSCRPRASGPASPDGALQLWYRQPAQNWNEALPVGNGRMGAMIFGGIDTAQFQLNDATLWSAEPHETNNPGAKDVLPAIRKALFSGHYEEANALARRMMGPYVATYLTLGSLYLDFGGGKDTISHYTRKLDLGLARATTTFRRGDVVYTRETFCSYPDQVLVIHLKANKPRALSFSTRFTNPMPHIVVPRGNHMVMMTGHAPSYVAHRNYEKQQLVYDSAHASRFAVALHADIKDGEIHADEGGLTVKNATAVTLLLSTGTSFNGFDKSPAGQGKDAVGEAMTSIQKAAAQAPEQLFANHEKDYRRLFDKVVLDLGTDSASALPTDERLRQYTEAGGYRDPQLVTLLFQYGRYLLIAASRPGGPPANLQGIWNNSMQPPWGSNYTTNINIEMNYWPAEKDNLSECAEPLFQFIGELAQRGAVTAKVNYGARGWVAHHNSDIWAQSAPPGNYGKDPQATPRWAMWPMSGAWLCRHLWEHYLFTGDTLFLRQKAYPLMKGAALFMLDWLIPYQHHLVTAPSTSPEHAFTIDGHPTGTVSIASTMDMSIIRDLFFNTICASEVLDSDQAFCDRLRNSYKKLFPFHIGQYGQLQEWYKDWDDPKDEHRHVSHLYGLFPANLISPRRTPVLAAAARKSLELRGDGGTGWSKAWKVNWWARLEDGDHAFKMLNKQLFLAGHRHDDPDSRGGSYLNLFDAHPPFQIDGNFGVTSGITEMLLQSDDGAIYLLPALPQAWAKGQVQGLSARGGFQLRNMTWENHHLVKATLVSTLGGICRLRTQVPILVNGAEGREARGGNPNPYFKTPPVESLVVSDSTVLEPISLPGTYVTDISTVRGDTIEIMAKQ